MRSRTVSFPSSWLRWCRPSGIRTPLRAGPTPQHAGVRPISGDLTPDPGRHGLRRPFRHLGRGRGELRVRPERADLPVRCRHRGGARHSPERPADEARVDSGWGTARLGAGSTIPPCLRTAPCRAFYRDRNLFISAPDGTGEIAVTTEGDEEARTKFGTGSWVYGEELNQNTAMWWSPDGSKLAYYGFDEGPVLDYYLQMDQTQIQSSLDVEAYPKAGAPNPVVTLFVYDLATGTSTEMDVRDGQPFTNDVVGHYVYRIEWSPDGSELTFQRTNRRQNINEFTACDPSTGACRVDRQGGMAGQLGRESSPQSSTWPTASAFSGSRSGQGWQEHLSLRPERRAPGHRHRPRVRGGQHASGWTRKRAWSTTWPGTATTT